MPPHDLDSNVEYKRQRVAAAQEVERLIHEDERILGIFRERIRFAGELYRANEKEMEDVGERQEQLRWLDWMDALRDARLRDMLAGPPSAEYEWRPHTSYEWNNRPTQEDFRQMQEEGFVGTWESVKHAWEEKRWGYWRRKCPVAEPR